MAIQSYSKHFVPPAPLNPNYKSSLTLVLVDSLDKLKDSFQYGKVVAWDTETTGLNPEQSEIVGFSYSFDGKLAYYCPVKHIDIHLGKDALDAFYEMLTKSKMQLLYNARFDIRMMEYSGYDMSFLYAKDDKGKSTYKFIDVMNAVWLADTNITMPTLKASTLHFLGYQPPKFLETLGSEANFQYVPSADAYEYACLDAANTYNLFKAVYPYFKEAGLSAQLDNACTYIIGQLEKQILKLDLNYFVNLRDEIAEDISELKKKIYAIAGHEFNISSGRELTHVFLEQGIDTGERTKAGDMKTSIKMLSLYKKYHPECELMDLLVEYKEKIKCYNSYLKTLVEIASKQNEVPPRFSYKLQSVPCLTDRNVVMLKDIGLVSVAQVQADDYIWTQYGYKKVLWCHEHKVDEVYQVIFDNGSIIEGTDKHPVLVNKGNDTNIDVEWATLESLKDGEEVIFNHHTPLIKFSDTKDDTSAVFSLYMGVLASYYLNDNVKDLQAYKETVQALTEHQNKEDREILFHVITHAEAIMKEVVGFSPTEMVCFLQGVYALLFQLDESRYWNRSLEDDTFSIVINRNPITPLILNILKFLGIASRLDKSESSDTWKITIYSKQGCTLFKYLIVDGIDLFALQDLFEHYNPSGIYKEYASSKVLKKTIKKDVVSVYDIEVEGVHEYIANGVVTHNTGRLSCLSGDSKIHTIMGDIPIRELSKYEQGNEVYIDPNTTASFKTLYMGKKPCFKVEMETGEILYATHDHQFLDSSTEWKRVDALKVGDKLLHSTRVLSSSNVKSITEDKEQDVYTLSVNHYRHQYVSDNLISHNCGKDGKNSYFSPINLQSTPKPKSTKCFGRLATQEEIDNKQDLMGWIFSDEHPEWSVGKVVEGMSPKGNVRMGFIPENGKDDYLVSIDMSSEELRVVTNLYQEHSWADVIKSGGDLHHRNSDAIFGAENYTKETRKRAKCAAFGMLYGQGPKGFQSNFPDMTLDEAKEFLTKFKKIIPNIISGQDRDIRIARQTGTVYTSFHRPRRVKADLQSTDKREVAFGERTVKNCYSPDTEFLTEYGWLLAKDIKPDTLIAYYEPNVGKVFYTKAGERYTNSCTESIICSSNKTSWNVTTNHRMWIRLKNEHKWGFIEAKELLYNREFYYKDNSYLSESFCDMSDYISSSFGCLPKSLVFAIIANYISELYSFNAPLYDKKTLLNSCIKDIINKDDLISYLDSDNEFINSMLEIIDKEEKNGFKDILKSSLSDRLVFIDSLNYYIGRDENERLCRVIMSEDKKYLDNVQIIMNMSGFTSHIKEITKETLSLYSLYYDFDSSADVPLTSKDITLVKHEKPIEYSCFNVPSHILITRHKGFISYHGNTGIQGTAADVLKLEFIRLWDNIFTKYPEVKFHSTIHDEINFSVPRKLAREVIPIMIKCMTVTMPNWLVALDCSLSIGYNLGSLIPFKYNAETQEFIPDWEEDLRKEKKEDEEPINEYEDDEDSQDSIEDIELDSIDYRMYDL